MAQKQKNNVMTDQEVADMQHRIDEGLHLVQQKLVNRAIHDGLSLVVMRGGHLMEINGADLNQ